MPSLGTVDVQFDAKTAAFNQNVKCVREALDRFRKETEKARRASNDNQKAVGGVAGAYGLAGGAVGDLATKFTGLKLGLAGVGVGLVLASKNAIETNAKMLELARSTGFAFGEFQSIAELLKQDSLSLGKTTSSLNCFNCVIGDARQGLASAERAFDALGLDPHEIEANADGLLEVAEGLRNLTSHAERSTRAQELFGRGGAALLPVLLQSDAAIRQKIETQKTYGQITEENAQAIKDFSQAMDDAAQFASTTFSVASWRGEPPAGGAAQRDDRGAN